MLFKLYSEKDVKKLVARLKAEYEETVDSHRAAEEGLKEENRRLRARVSELETERSGAFSAFAAADAAKDAARKEGEQACEAERRELALLIQKCRTALDRLRAKYPDEEDVAAFDAFCRELNGETDEDGFDMSEVTSPKGPLDLGKLCKELGVMEDEE